MKNNIVEFLRSKDYKFIKNIGQGGTGKTVLLEDESINERFVCKKYSPLYDEHRDQYFGNFIYEIKLLHLLYHQNVVRVFNYHLYPEKTTGYILMEYVDGLSISDYIIKNPDMINEVFIQVIRGFSNLEGNQILHRDIRPANIMVSNEGNVKIIDFGFGKKIDFDVTDSNSISLNWRYSIPLDFANKVYNYCTEIYFIGKLFEELVIENDLQSFSFPELLQEMIQPDPLYRIESFFEIERKIIEGNSSGIEFSDSDVLIYQDFFNEVRGLYATISTTAEYIQDTDVIIGSLETCYRNSMLETVIQNPLSIARCFVKGDYTYYSSAKIHVKHLKAFLNLIKYLSSDKQKIIINNFWQRLDTYDRYVKEIGDGDDLPF